MIFVENDVIYIHRGDYGTLDVAIDAGDESYELQDGDVLTLSVRELPTAESPLLIQVHSDSPRFVLNPADTRELNPGAYSADVQLTMPGGRIVTVWPLREGRKRQQVSNFKNFIIMPEVTIE